MSDPNGNRPAFPMVFSGFEPTHTGLSAREHAAITLRVPSSGTPWLDAMIRESRRRDAAQTAMQGICAALGSIPAPGGQEGRGPRVMARFGFTEAGADARALAAALLSALEDK